MSVVVAAFYKFVRFDDPAAIRSALLAACAGSRVKGTILLATEGINGTIAGPADGIDKVLAHIRALPGCASIDIKFSRARTMPFYRMKVRIKTEIVTLRAPEADPAQPGTYVEPQDWNALVDDPEVVLIDTRNSYEVAIGSFAGALNPKTQSFSDLPHWLAAFKTSLPAENPRPKIAMFCTGGIRCEKSTALLRAHGFEDVVHLRGGILKYLEEVPAEHSRWHGECFVFDQRVSVGHGLAPGSYVSCHACRMPLALADVEHPAFEEGVSCPFCVEARDPTQRARYAERARQVQRAVQEGREHIGMQMR